MKTFEIEITETLQRVVKVKANSENEAYSIVKQQYINEEIVLDDSDLLNNEINHYLYSKNQDYLYENEDFKNFVLKNSESMITHMSIEELTKLAFGDIENAKNEYYKQQS